MRNSTANKADSKRPQGFTLLEMLVVLILVGLISTVLFHGMGHVMRLHGRFLSQLYHTRQGALQEHWFRSSTAALLADYPDAEHGHLFEGGEHRFSGLSIASLDAQTGVPTAFAWQLRPNGTSLSLEYETAKADTWAVLTDLADSSSFSYLAQDGSWHRQWPPALGEPPSQLPVAIALSGIYQHAPLFWIVKLPGLKDARQTYKHLLDL